MLNQIRFSISSEKANESMEYANIDISQVVTKKLRYCYEVRLSSGEDMATYFCQKKQRNQFGQTWFAYDNLDCKGKPEFEAYTFRNLKGMIAE